ncbi:hypothetical protein BGZ73_004865 [Actinomortierella ambigua]|nr:hypothetical protein BGZ73_004865 [Actinomortierella ambigua]
MKINAILILSTLAAVALATPVASSQRALYRRDRFRRQLPDLTKVVQTATDVADLNKRQGGLSVNGKPALEGTQALVGGLVSPSGVSATPGDAAGSKLAVRDLPGGNLLKPVTDVVGGLTGSKAPSSEAPAATDAASDLAARDLPGGNLLKPVTDVVGGLTGSKAPSSEAPAATDATNGLATRDLPGTDVAKPALGLANDLLGGQ